MHPLYCNDCDQNIIDISDALFTLKIQYEHNQTQCEVGARDVNNILVKVVLFLSAKMSVKAFN